MRPTLPLLLLLAGVLQAQQASIVGVVSDQTGQPLQNAHIRFITGDFDQAGIDSVYGAMSDQAGRFSIEKLKAGFYIVIAERTGYIQIAAPESPLGFATLGLKADQHLTDFKLVMAARATISGRVADDFGDPVQNVSVNAEVAPPGKQQESITGNRSASTDDHGEFRLVLAPGKYLLHTNSFGGRVQGETRTDGTSAEPFVSTYFPSATDAAAASAIPVGAGQDVGGIEIRLTRMAGHSTPSHGFTISGVVSGTANEEFATVQVRFGSDPSKMYDMRNTAAGPDGKFSLDGMQPGFYSVSAAHLGGKTPMQSRPVTFQLESGDRTNIQLTLQPGEELSGTLQFTGNGAAAPESPAVRLETAGGYDPFGQSAPPAATVAKDGTFKIANVLPGSFKLVVEPMPENSYVKEIALDGKPVIGPLDFSQGVGGSRVKVTVSRSGAKLSGRILGKTGEPETGLMMVFLASSPKDVDEDNAKHTSDGTYSFQAVAPGKYHLFALDMVQLISAFAGSDNEESVMQSFFDAGDVIEIKEGDHLQKDIAPFTKLPEKK